MVVGGGRLRGHVVCGGGVSHGSHGSHGRHWVGGRGRGGLVDSLRHVHLLTVAVGGATNGDLDMAA